MSQILQEFEPIIGIETHIQLKTNTKAFCRCANSYGASANSNVCPVCLGHPGIVDCGRLKAISSLKFTNEQSTLKGTLPVLNDAIPLKGTQMALALNTRINQLSKFDRKQYFYPDLPKGYQISQFDLPFCEDGYIEIPQDQGFKQIGIERAHLEEDSGKLSHSGGQAISASQNSSADYNRAGIPLMEIVSKPDMRAGIEASLYGQEIQRICRYLNVSDANMDEGQLRCDVNISIRKIGAEKFGTKVEIKNLNSFSNVQKAIDYEIQRQADLINKEQINEIVQETRTWDEKQGQTISLRKKEGLADYRYFPEPDLPPLKLDDQYIAEIKQNIPQLPAAKRRKYQEMGIQMENILILSDDSSTSQYFDEVIQLGADAKQAVNWIIGDIMAYVKDKQVSFSEIKLRPSALAEMIDLILKEIISGKIGKGLVKDILQGNKDITSVKQIVEDQGLSQISDPKQIEQIIRSVIDKNPEQYQAYKSGKTKLIGFFNGEIMKETKGRVNPKEMNKILKQVLDS